jgi:uncharacterized protein (TIGR03437 family)
MNVKSLYFVSGLLVACCSLAPAQLYLTSTVAGTPGTAGYGGDGAPPLGAVLANPLCIAFDSKGDYYISDYKNNRIREVVAPNGPVITVAGTGTPGFSGDGGPATSAQFSSATGLAVDAAGNLYIADGPNARVRMIDTSGNMQTFAGTGNHGYSGDGGPAVNADLVNPVGVTVDHAGTVYIADEGNGTVRKVTTDGVISTIAGIGVIGFGNFPGQGGPASRATLGLPYAVAVDESGNVFIADIGSGSIEKVGLDGNINTVVAGASTAGLAADPSGNLYFANYHNSTISQLSPYGAIVTIGGNGSNGFSGDGGPGISAEFNAPYGVALDSSSNVYIADYNNQVIRMLSPVVSPQVIVANGGSDVQYSSPGVQMPVAPGEIVTIFGTNIGAPVTISAQPNGNGYIGTQLAGTMVTFNGIPAPVLSTGPSQVTAVAPYELTAESASVRGRMSGSRGRIVPEASSSNGTTILVTYQGQSTATTTVPVGDSSPGIFSVYSSGIPGGLGVLNADGSVNSVYNAAAQSSKITLFVTGEGQTNPGGVDGLISTQSTLPVPQLPVTVTIGGTVAALVSATEASGYVAGIMQVVVTLPSTQITGSYVPVTVQVGDVVSPTITISVQ